MDVHAHFLTDHRVDAVIAAEHLHPDGMPGWPSWRPYLAKRRLTFP